MARNEKRAPRTPPVPREAPVATPHEAPAPYAAPVARDAGWRGHAGDACQRGKHIGAPNNRVLVNPARHVLELKLSK